MSKTINSFTKVIPNEKNQKNIILEQLSKPIALELLTDEELNVLMEQAIKSYEEGYCADVNEFIDELGL